MAGISLEHLGNLHLVLLHLPIGFVVAAVLLEVSLWRRASAEGERYQRVLLGLNVVAALFTVGAGFLLAATGTYPADTLEPHRWAGVACAILAAFVWLVQRRGKKVLVRAGLGAALVCTVVAGHLGATLTHGAGVLDFWSPAPAPMDVRNSASAADIPRTTVPSPDFLTRIQPILEDNCVECHGPDKVKGRLRLDSRAAALAGGRSGRPAITPGHPEESELLRRVRLPRDDDEAMPSSDEPGLSAAEIATLEQWIAAGAEWH